MKFTLCTEDIKTPSCAHELHACNFHNVNGRLGNLLKPRRSTGLNNDNFLRYYVVLRWQLPKMLLACIHRGLDLKGFFF